MEKICNWILNGKGRGKRYLLLLSAFFAGVTCSVIYFSWNNFLKTPQMQEIIQNLPSLTLQNGQLTEPQDSYQNITWSMTNNQNSGLSDYHFIINTQTDDNDTKEAPKNGIYITRKNIYILNDGSLSIQPLNKIPDFKIEKGQIKNILEKGNIRFSFLLFFSLTLFLFINFYIWSLIYALFSYGLTLFIPSEEYPFSVRRRLSVICLICGYIFILPLSFWGFYVSIFVFFITVLIFMSLFLTFMPKIFIISVDN